jgi:uncharacterized protein (DUF305 family)
MRLPVTLAVAATVLLLAGCGTKADDAPATASTGAAGAAATAGGDFNETDVMFLQMLGPHHTQGVAIVKLAAERASREEIKTLAKAIEVTQADELTRMSGWLQEWKQPATASADAHAEHGGQPGTSEQEISLLREAKGADFDTRFVNTLIAHQDDAIQLAKMENVGGKNESAKAFAKQVEESRAAQVKHLLDLTKK